MEASLFPRRGVAWCLSFPRLPPVRPAGQKLVHPPRAPRALEVSSFRSVLASRKPTLRWDPTADT